MGTNVRQGVFGTPNIVTNGLVHYLDAGSRQSYVSGSTTWSDLSGNNITGTLTNGPTFNSDNLGAIVFNVATRNKVAFSGVALTTTHTVNLWIYAVASDNFGCLYTQGASIGVFYRSTDKISFFYTAAHDSAFTVTKNQWTNITVTCNAGAVLYYKNTVLDTTRYTGGVTYTPDSMGDDPSNETFGGRIAMLQVYNRALSQQEITQNYNATKARFGLT